MRPLFRLLLVLGIADAIWTAAWLGIDLWFRNTCDPATGGCEGTPEVAFLFIWSLPQILIVPLALVLLVSVLYERTR